jgi:hypothetical protein
MAIRFEPKTPEPEKERPKGAVPAAPVATDLDLESENADKAKRKSPTRGARSKGGKAAGG